jgi:hypothetical protein
MLPHCRVAQRNDKTHHITNIVASDLVVDKTMYTFGGSCGKWSSEEAL